MENDLQIFQEAPEAMLLIDSKGIILEINKHFSKVYGYSEQELKGKNVSILFPEDERERYKYKHDEFWKNRAPSKNAALELPGLKKDGSTFPADVLLALISTSKGEVVLCVIRDITERKNNELAIKTSQAMFMGLFENSPDAIVVVDEKGSIKQVNTQLENLFGYKRDELYGKRVEVLMPDRFRQVHVQHREGFFQKPKARMMGAGLDLFGRKKDGHEFPVDILLSPMQLSEETLVLAVIRDITQRKFAEAQIKEAARRKALLVKEIHHRVKNNLQIISSLLFLQEGFVSDPKNLNALKDSQLRIRSIALIHEKLYQSEEEIKIDFSDYIESLIHELFHSYKVEEASVAFDLKIEKTLLSIDAAVPCGLIISELISNILKYAFKPDQRDKKICIEIHNLGKREYRLKVCDNGVGFPPDFIPEKSEKMGYMLILDLVKQLEGKLDIDNQPGKGLSISITFKEPTYKERLYKDEKKNLNR